ncbi:MULTISPECIES: ABC transporter permease [unclassified Isoptericola]|uniref:ABC transporter permease n=1 Tax=unclassified Isoptericola TaxID=2623355 RepID=UPI0027122D8A|nr:MULTISPECIES: ABC transporter permease [unclassified Isoptericola]MDO8144298.1 ABC transporter permease [Isoptericola sp. 178]MDO8148152.1 ABC transporter permease [Isoptericola sp. b515]MDO8151629.1 ABC transporter permease [Isoptericola sp. b408]
MTELQNPPAEEKSYSQGQLVRMRFFRHKGAIISMVVMALVILVAFTSIGIGPIPGWWDKVPELQYPKIDDGSPTWTHPFGQDTGGKDYFSLVMLGTQKSLIIAFGVGLISTVIGTLVGALAGYFRGWIESVLMRMTDLLLVIPLLVLAAVLGKMASSWGIWGLTLMLGIVTWTGLARLVRGEVLSLREREFVVAAYAVGTSSSRTIFKHILPNAIGTIIVSATLTISAAILLESALSFLGYGVQAPDTSLGLLISEYQTAFTTRPWLFWWPGLMILAIALSVNFIGDGLRDAFDPRQNRTKA